MKLPWHLTLGSHVLVSDPAAEWRIELSNTNPPNVVLTASILIPPNLPAYPIQVPWATSVEIQMNAAVAIELHKKLGELIQRMGWLPQQ
jgi:hypothetical protein